MERKNIILVTALIIMVFIVTAASSFYFFSNRNTSANNGNISNKGSIEKVLGANDLGKVTLEGPYGNINSPMKIAFIVGVHPLESNSHRAMEEQVKSQDKSLNYCYYIYKINVTKDPNDYDKGRMNGQLLANQFVVPNIIGQNYTLAADIHANDGNYKEKWFVFAPNEDKNSRSFALKIVNNVSGLVYYNPPSQTSPKYVTIPIIESGIPAIVYETYHYDSYDVTKAHEGNFLNVVDHMKIK
ncbi:MAG: hypothetical protein ACXVHS_06780 [Methanobacterium sp.]